MKISQQQKNKNRQNMIQAAADIVSASGFKKLTMSQVAKKAKVSEPVVYKYFSTKEDLLASYYFETLKKVIQSVHQQKDFTQMSFLEQLHLMLDAQLSYYEKNKRMIEETFNTVFLSPLSNSITIIAEQKKIFNQFTETLLDAAVASGELTSPPGKTMIIELLWDFYLGITYFWVKDSSDGQTRTLQLLDQSLGLLSEILNSNILGRLADILFFFAREHLLKSAAALGALTQAQKELKMRFFKGLTHG